MSAMFVSLVSSTRGAARACCSILLLALGAACTRPATAEPTFEQGLTFRLFDIGEPMDALFAVAEGQTPNVDEKRATIDFTSVADFGGIEDRFIVECSGRLNIPAAGLYGFRLTSDDGSEFKIDGRSFLKNDGIHHATDREGELTLIAGQHPFEVRYFDDLYLQRLRLQWRPPGATEFVTVPAEAFLTESGVKRVVTPGKKKIIRPSGGPQPVSSEPVAGVPLK